MKRITLLAVLFLVVGSISAFAFGLPKLGGSSSQDVGEDKATPVIVAYTASLELFKKAEASALEAFGFKTEAAISQAEAESAGKGNLNSDDISKSAQVSTDAQKLILEAIAKGEVLSDEAKAKLKESAVNAGKGLVAETAVGTLVADAVSATQTQVQQLSSNPMQLGAVKGRLDTLLTVSKLIPDDLVQKKNLLSAYINYFKSQNIELPADVTDLI